MRRHNTRPPRPRSGFAAGRRLARYGLGRAPGTWRLAHARTAEPAGAQRIDLPAATSPAGPCQPPPPTTLALCSTHTQANATALGSVVVTACCVLSVSSGARPSMPAVERSPLHQTIPIHPCHAGEKGARISSPRRYTIQILEGGRYNRGKRLIGYFVQLLETRLHDHLA